MESKVKLRDKQKNLPGHHTFGATGSSGIQEVTDPKPLIFYTVNSDNFHGATRLTKSGTEIILLI